MTTSHRLLACILIQIATAVSVNGTGNDPQQDGSSRAAAKQNSRSPVPGKKDIEAARKALTAEKGIDFRSTRSSDAAKVANLLLTAVVAEENPVRRYVLLSDAVENASRAAEIDLAIRTIDLLGEEFVVDAVELKKAAIDKRSRIRQPAPDYYDLSLRSYALAESVIDLHGYTRGLALLDDSIDFSKRVPAASLSQQLLQIEADWKKWNTEYQSAKPAQTRLKAVPGDKPASTVWGRFLCLKKGDWESGLPFLAAGEPGNVLTALAVRENRKPRSFDDVVQLTDEWLRVADSASKEDAESVRDHAYSVGQKAFLTADANQLTPLEIKMAKAFGDTPITQTAENQNGLSLGGAQSNLGLYATIELWIRATDTDGSIISKRHSAADSSVGLDIEGGYICYYAHGPDHSSLKHTSQRIDDGMWHHVAAVKIGDRFTVFVDGKVAGASILIRPEMTSKTDWHLGYMMVEQQSPLTASYARIRISSIARYHVEFEPDWKYGPDTASMLFR